MKPSIISSTVAQHLIKLHKEPINQLPKGYCIVVGDDTAELKLSRSCLLYICTTDRMHTYWPQILRLVTNIQESVQTSNLSIYGIDFDCWTAFLVSLSATPFPVFLGNRESTI